MKWSFRNCLVEKTDARIALVICTRNRAPKLGAFFESLRRLKCDSPWELVIVDNGSTDDTAMQLKTFAETFPIRAKLVTELQAGLGRARNCGWRATNAPVIAFTDDDCYPDPNFLNDVLAIYADKSVGFSGGRTVLFDPTDAPITVYEHPATQIYPPQHFILGGVIHGANMAFRREALVAIDGFDDNLGAGTPFAFEDVDAQLRALAAGWTGKYDPHPLVQHHHGRKPGIEVDKLSLAYDVGRGGYFMKCILHTPFRWNCLRHWQRVIRRQPFGQTWREVKAALRYFVYQLKRKPNVSY